MLLNPMGVRGPRGVGPSDIEFGGCLRKFNYVVNCCCQWMSASKMEVFTIYKGEII